MFFGLLLAWAVPEVALRVASHEYRFINFWAVNRDLFRSAYPARFDDRLGWVPRPGPATTRNVWGTRVTILEDGIRSNGPGSIASADSGGLILTVGDSFTYGDQVSDDETWPACLERLTGVRTLNGGVFGYGLDQSMLRMAALARKYHPTCIVLSFIFDDVLRCGLAERTSVAKPYFEMSDGKLTLHVEHIRQHLHRDDPVKSVLGHSYLIHRLMARAFPEYWFQGASSNQVTFQYTQPIACALLHSLSDYLASIPNPPRLYVLVQYEEKQDSDLFGKIDMLLPCMKDPRVHVVDLRDTLAVVRRRGAAEYGRLFHSHMTPAGNELVARLLASRMARDEAHPAR